MLEVRLIEIVNPEKYPKIMILWRRQCSRYSEKKSFGGLVVASPRKSGVEQVVVYQYGRARTYIAKKVKLIM